MAADPADVAAVESFAATYHLQVTAADPETRTVKLAGTAQQCEQAFGVQLQQASGADGATYLTYSGTIDLPADVAPAIVAVLGLDTHPAARARPQGAG